MRGRPVYTRWAMLFPLRSRDLRTACSLLSLLFALGIGTLGCGSGAPLPNANTPANSEKVTPVDVRDEDFSASLYGLLKNGKPSPGRDGMLVGVVRSQLAHAAKRFELGHPERATDSVIGAMYLLRSGEGRAEMVDAVGEKALAGAISKLSARGDEGRAIAFMQMRAAALAPGSAERAELEEHMNALSVWMKETRTGKPIRRYSTDERALVARSLVDPSAAAFADAVKAVNAWIDAAIDFHGEFRQTGQRPAREDAVEAARALESGAVTLAALHIRNGNAKGALEALKASSARRIMPPDLLEPLAGAAFDDDARAWQMLAATFAQIAENPEADMETGPDQVLLRAAIWGAGLEAFRRDPSDIRVAMLMSRSLVELGLCEAVPHMLSEALGQEPDPRALSASLEMSMVALNQDAQGDDVQAVRRTFRALTPMLALAEKSKWAQMLEPSAANVRSMVAMIELRAGNLAAARPLLEQAVNAEPSIAGYSMLALLERQAGDRDKVLSYVGRALAAPDARSAPIEVAEALMISFEAHRESGDQAKAKQDLDRALSVALSARSAANSPINATRAERILGRVLDGYGDAKGAARALERALHAAGSERPLLGAAVLDAVGRALLRRDVDAARAALKHGIDGDVADDELVYGGLWVMFLEREMKVQSDGTAERALKISGDRGTWTGKLSAWAGGRMTDGELLSAAQNTAQRIEAIFYTAMQKRAAGDPSANDKLREVAKSPVIDLLEVNLAREMLAPRIQAELPADLKIP